MTTNRPLVTPYITTFAGIDDKVEFGPLTNLTSLYRDIEFAVLVHQEKFGTKRYPSVGWIMQLQDFVREWNSEGNLDIDFRRQPISTSLHICGEYLDMLLDVGYCGLEHLTESFSRVQFNVGDRVLSYEDKLLLKAWADNYGQMSTIIQVSEWPLDDTVGYLYDRSRGRGISTGSFPDPLNPPNQTGRARVIYRDHYPGFAGGISPSNVVEVCNQLHRTTGVSYFNIDMESGVRDTNNEFSLAKCEQVCEAIFGKRMWLGDSLIQAEDLEIEQARQERNRRRNHGGEVPEGFEEPEREDRNPRRAQEMLRQAEEFFETHGNDEIYIDDEGTAWRYDLDWETVMEVNDYE